MTLDDVFAKFILYEQLYPMYSLRLYNDMSGYVLNEDDEEELSFDTLDELYEYLVEQTEVDE